MNHSGVLYEPPGIPMFRQGEDVKTATATRPLAAELGGAVLVHDRPRCGAGRDELNFSTWDSDDGEADDAAGAVADGSMPPRRYVLVHPDARLSDAERRVLADALEAMDRGRGGDRSGPGGGG